MKRGTKTFSGKRVKLGKAQIINSSSDIELYTEFFLEISVNGAQNFEFFELCKSVLDGSSF